jgi:hypothetical protein
VRLVQAWSAMQQSVNDDAIDEWRRRLRFCVSAKDEHFEHIVIDSDVLIC